MCSIFMWHDYKYYDTEGGVENFSGSCNTDERLEYLAVLFIPPFSCPSLNMREYSNGYVDGG